MFDVTYINQQIQTAFTTLMKELEPKDAKKE